MKKIKLFLCVALFGAMSFGVFSAYDHLTMNDAERALLENVEALTSGESGFERCFPLEDGDCREIVVTPSGNYIRPVQDQEFYPGIHI